MQATDHNIPIITGSWGIEPAVAATSLKEEIAGKITGALRLEDFNQKAAAFNSIFGQLKEIAKAEGNQLPKELSLQLYDLLEAYTHHMIYNKGDYTLSAAVSGFSVLHQLNEIGAANETTDWTQFSTLEDLVKFAQARESQIFSQIEQLKTASTEVLADLSEAFNISSPLAKTLTRLSFSYQNTPQFLNSAKVPLHRYLTELTEAVIQKKEPEQSIKDLYTFRYNRIAFNVNLCVFEGSLAASERKNIALQGYEAFEKEFKEKFTDETDFYRWGLLSQIANMKNIMSDGRIAKNPESDPRRAFVIREALFKVEDDKKLENESLLSNIRTVIIGTILDKPLTKESYQEAKMHADALSVYLAKLTANGMPGFFYKESYQSAVQKVLTLTVPKEWQK